MFGGYARSMKQQDIEEHELDTLLRSLETKGLIEQVGGGYRLTKAGYIQGLMEAVKTGSLETLKA